MSGRYATALEQIRAILHSRTQGQPTLQAKHVSDELTCWPIPPLRTIRWYMERVRKESETATVARKCSVPLDIVNHSSHKHFTQGSIMYNDSMKRDMYRDMAAKAHLQARMVRSCVPFACDALETETAEEYCARMLQKMELKVGGNPIENLTMLLKGREGAARDLRHAGMDAAHHTLEGTAVDAFFASFGK